MAALEVKLGEADIDQAAANLLSFAKKVDSTKVGEPAALTVVTATGYGYTRPDGVVKGGCVVADERVGECVHDR